MGDEISRLQRERDEAERTIGALKHRIGEQTDEIARLTRERDEAERVAVWAWKSAQPIVGAGVNAFVEFPGVELYGWESDSEIYCALRQAMEGRGDEESKRGMA